MGKLLVKLLDPKAKAPNVAHEGEDLGYDVYALEDTFLERGRPTVVKTGIAAVYVEIPDESVWYAFGSLEAWNSNWYTQSKKFGLEIRDRSSMAAKNGIEVMAGVIDAGYRGEIGIVLNLTGPPLYDHPEDLAKRREYMEEVFTPGTKLEELHEHWQEMVAREHPVRRGYLIKAGDKIAQLLPREVLTAPVEVVDELPSSNRGDKGFGSSGR